MPATGEVVQTLSVNATIDLLCKCLWEATPDTVNIAEELLKYQEWKIRIREAEADESVPDDVIEQLHDSEPVSKLKWRGNVMRELVEIFGEQPVIAALKTRADWYAEINLEEVLEMAECDIQNAIYRIEERVERLPYEKREEIESAFRQALLQQAHEIC